jgi:hypothetical protein
MIQKFLSFLVIATISMSLNFAKAQVCTPDTNLKAPGFLPNELQDAQINTAYSQSITVLAFKDTTVKQGATNIKVYIDSMKITNFIGLPNGLTYNCLSPSCAFTPKALSCAVLKGTPTESGIFPLKVVIMIYSKISGIIPYSTTDTVRSFTLNVTGSAGMKMINLNELNAYPNPTSGLTYITSLVQPRIYNSVGQLLKVDFTKNEVGYSFDSRSLKSGIYSVVCGNKSIKLVVD